MSSSIKTVTFEPISDVKTFQTKSKDHSVFYFEKASLGKPEYKSLLERLSKNHETIGFYWVDVDNASGVMAEAKVTQTPVVIEFKNGQNFRQLVQPDYGSLRTFINELQTPELQTP